MSGRCCSIFKCVIFTFSECYLGQLLWNSPQHSANGFNLGIVNIGSGNGLVQATSHYLNQCLPYQDLCHHMMSGGHIELMELFFRSHPNFKLMRSTKIWPWHNKKAFVVCANICCNLIVRNGNLCYNGKITTYQWNRLRTGILKCTKLRKDQLHPLLFSGLILPGSPFVSLILMHLVCQFLLSFACMQIPNNRSVIKDYTVVIFTLYSQSRKLC